MNRLDKNLQTAVGVINLNSYPVTISAKTRIPIFSNYETNTSI